MSRWTMWAAWATWTAGQQLEGDAHRLARVVAALAADVVLERLALDVLHDDVVGAVDRAPVVDVDDVGVVDAGGGLGLAAEALDELARRRRSARAAP